jgi:hypothetical protein
MLRVSHIVRPVLWGLMAVKDRMVPDRLWSPAHRVIRAPDRATTGAQSATMPRPHGGEQAWSVNLWPPFAYARGLA